MNRPASGRAWGQWAGWALPILAGLFLAPAGARASCGDYVVTKGAHAVPAGAPHKPCHGPHCSQAPAAPLAPAPSVHPDTSEEWGCATAGLALAPPGSTATLPSHDERRPARLPRRVFHPPRLAA